MQLSPFLCRVLNMKLSAAVVAVLLCSCLVSAKNIVNMPGYSECSSGRRRRRC
jgi:hypothetical protein